MTIDEAIKYADMLSCNVNAFEVSKQFGAMCADALRLAKKMSDDAGISATPAQYTWQERRKRESHDDGLVVFDATVDDMQVFNTMCAIKDMFFGEDERVMQFHPPKSEYINNYPYCLHLWRPVDTEIPHPPMICV